jgi:hypothetical protein
MNQKTIRQKADRIGKIVLPWMFGDFIYAVIPILLLLLIIHLLGKSYAGFLELKEWSFANIVLFGVGIREFVELRVRHLRSTRSFTPHWGIQLLVVSLMVAVLVLFIAVLSEKGALPAGHEVTLGRTQLVLFLMASSWSLISEAAKQSSIEHNASLFSAAAGGIRFVQMNDELNDIEKNLGRIASAIEKDKAVPTIEARRAAGSDKRERDRQASIACAACARIMKTTKEIDDYFGRYDDRSVAATQG